MADQSHPIALIVGGSRGIGKATALRLAKSGCDIWLTYRSNHEQANETKKAIESLGRSCELMAFDVADREATEAALRPRAEERSPDIVVFNAGVTRDNLLARMKDDEWQDILDTNLTPVFRLSRAVLRGMMKARKGRIISIASVVGFMGNPGQTNYVAAKAGMVGFTKALAREVGSRGITVNCVVPGCIETDMTKALAQEQVTKLVENVPLGRLGHVSDIAEAVLFLASPGAGYITGNTIHVNGGMYM